MRCFFHAEKKSNVSEPIKVGSKFIIDGKSVFLCDATRNKLKAIIVGELPGWSKGENEIVVKSEFSGEEALALNFDFKSVGEAEIVKGKWQCRDILCL